MNIGEISSAFFRIAPHPLSWISWKRRNRHNMTAPVNYFDHSLVTVGNGSYGGIEVYTYGSPKAHLQIGNYVSIGPHVRFMLSGEHDINGVSTYPFEAYDPVEPRCVDICRGPIIIGDDVWIGMGTTILSGVKIGQGAVIGACALVTKDVEPYSVVGGVPAKLIRYRFSEELRTKLCAIDWSKITPAKAHELRDTLKEKVSAENVDRIIAALKD